MHLKKILLTSSDFISGIVVGGRWQAVTELIPDKDVVIITDDNVFDLYGACFPPFPVIKIKPGETGKRLVIVEQIVCKLLKLGIDRSGFLLAVGGGVVSDMTGFIASVYMRGIRFGIVSTSLLSQADASVGGKNGVNAGGAKNVIGSFKQPEFVVCDTFMLKTLPQEEYLSGLSELIKTGLIGNKTMIDTLEEKYDKVRERDRDVMTGLVAEAVKFKGGIVAEDEKENGLRRVLNFGHSYGHAIEMITGCKHGVAVAEGMAVAIRFSNKCGYLSDGDAAAALSLLTKYDLNRHLHVSAAEMKTYLQFDKKRVDNDIYFVFLSEIGKAFVKKIPVDDLLTYYVEYLNVK